MPRETREGDQPAEAQEARPLPAPGSGLSDSGRAAMQGVPDDGAAAADAAERTISGNPERDARFYHEQEHADSCAVAAQRGVLEKHTGEDPGEEALRREAADKGWYTPGEGTPAADAGNLLEAHGVPTRRWEHADMAVLGSELEQGHDVLAGVDAGILWNDPDSLGEGHRVWVTGLERDSGGNATGVYLNDSGNPEIGAGGRVPAERFRAAWAERGNPMVSTRRAA